MGHPLEKGLAAGFYPCGKAWKTKMWKTHDSGRSGTWKLRMKKVRPGAQLPQRQTAGSAGFDLCACIQEPVVLEPGDSALFPTGLAAEIPQGHVGLIFTRSGLGVKHGVAVSNGVGVIDSDYRGEILVGLQNSGDSDYRGELHVGLRNHSREAYAIQPGERVAQLVILPVCLPELAEVEELSETARGQGGFGSTGR